MAADARLTMMQMTSRRTVLKQNLIVLALPRGGMPVAYEVASAIDEPMDVFVVRKLGVPGYEELAMGAVATGGVRVLNDQLVTRLGIPNHVIDAVATREQQELARREHLYRGGRPPPDVRGRTVIVDDGLATGATMHAAIQALWQQQPARTVVAVPTAAPETCEELRAEVDEVICAITPELFHAVGVWYQDFTQTTDEEVRELLAQRSTQSRGEKAPAWVESLLIEALRAAAYPLAGTARDHDPLMDRIGEARFALLGEASHGTHEFYWERAEITKRLITEKNFTAMAVEADWPDAHLGQPLCLGGERRHGRDGSARRFSPISDVDVAQHRRPSGLASAIPASIMSARTLRPTVL
jgi:predicted phosphoribosyltransferase